MDPRDPRPDGLSDDPSWRERAGLTGLRISARLLRGHPVLLETLPAAGTERALEGTTHAIRAMLESRADVFRRAIDAIERYGPELSRIPAEPGPSGTPSWGQDWFTGLDAAALYTFIREREPSRYHEIGSGNSTTFAAQAIRDGNLKTQILSVDPEPRVDVDLVCDEVIRAPLQDGDLDRVRALERGDVVLVDSSHYAMTNSDVVAFFLNLLPSLDPGVLVGIHDVFLPDDYPWWLAGRWYSEQYMLAAWLLGSRGTVDIRLASHYCATEQSLRSHLDSMWHRTGLPRIAYGSTFWLET
jgi:predicted O-methyltransferase YrrM